MARLTVKNHYDPKTGFIVADEVIALPRVLKESPNLAEAVQRGRARGVPVVAFATADRCAPCQQFKKDTLNDPAIVAMLSTPGLLAAHVEVDREAAIAQSVLGSAGIPVTYILLDGQVTARLAGLRSPDELRSFLQPHLKP